MVRFIYLGFTQKRKYFYCFSRPRFCLFEYRFVLFNFTVLFFARKIPEMHATESNRSAI